jgi:hypothetical protein
MISTTGTNPDDFVELATQDIASELNEWNNFEYDLSAYEGEQGYVAILHQPTGSTGYILLIDALKIENDNAAAEWIVVEGTTSPVAMTGLEPNTTYECQVQGIYVDGLSQWCDLVRFTTLDAAAMPEELAVDNITANSGDASWIGSQETYNIRYRTAAVNTGVAEDFTGYETGDVPTGWTVIDADGDGQNWYVWNLALDDGSTQVTLSSNSYINNYGPLTPDNWIVTPLCDKLPAQVSFDAWGQDPSYAAEHFQVYVSTGDDPTNVDDFVAISEEMIATGTQTNYQFDLGDYVGEAGYVAIRHFNVTDMYILNVTNFYMQGEGDTPPGEWVVVEGVTSPYTIDGLDPNTEYEVQVQGVVDEQNTTEWTNSVFFTTLDGEVPGMDEFYVVGTFNDWNQTEEGGRVVLEANEDGTEYSGDVTLAADGEFKIITPNGNDGWIWFGGVDENQAGFFLITSELLENNIDLVDGSNFRVVEAGVYNITVKEAPQTPKGLYQPLVMVVTYKGDPQAIDNINVDSQSNDWYNLNGQKLNGKPVTPGIYINGNKKVIVR